ncbi:TPA: ATP-binding cassette domain-containing protein, partial [Salmonella enterica subsp. enterica serovar Java]
MKVGVLMLVILSPLAPISLLSFMERTGGVESIVSQPIDSEELSIAFAERTLIDQLSFTAVPGDFMGIIGTSGSGKSSLIKALSNSSHCYTGTVKLNNVDITPISEDDIQSCLAYHSTNIL